jgi:DNA-binding LacI/PurR family transcriptional regulator
LIEKPGVSSVVPDYAEAARLAVERLYELGHREIAFGGEHYFAMDTYPARERIRGAEEAMTRFGLPFSRRDVLYKRIEPGERNSIFEGLMQRRPRPTAIFCFDDWTAMGVMRAALEAGLELPKELSVIGSNNEPRSERTHPPLTTINLPAEEMAAVAVDLLDEAIAYGPSAPPPRCGPARHPH